MGTWDVGPFENDAASDWVGDIADGGGWELAREAFLGVLRPPQEWSETEDEAVAAAWLVASRFGLDPARLPDEARRWVLTAPAPPEGLARMALDSLNVLGAGGSELYGTWSEADMLDEWLEASIIPARDVLMGKGAPTPSS